MEAQEISKKEGKCSFCSWKKCGISLVVTTVISTLTLAGLYVWYTQINATVKTLEDFPELEQQLDEDDIHAPISGTYELKSVTPNYKSYLESLGMPGFVASLVMSSSETVIVKDFGNGTINHQISAAMQADDNTYTLDEELRVPYFMNQGIMVNKFTRPKPNVLNFISYEPDKNWNFTSELVFSQKGMVQSQHFITKNVTSKKFYVRKGTEEEEEESENATEGGDEMEPDNFFGNSNDDEEDESDFFSDDDDGFFG